MNLIGRYPGRLLATDHVESELADDYPEQRARCEAAVRARLLDTCSVTDSAEVALFLASGRVCAWAQGNARRSLLPFLADMESPSMTTVRSMSRSEKQRLLERS